MSTDPATDLAAIVHARVKDYRSARHFSSAIGIDNNYVHRALHGKLSPDLYTLLLECGATFASALPPMVHETDMAAARVLIGRAPIDEYQRAAILACIDAILAMPAHDAIKLEGVA